MLNTWLTWISSGTSLSHLSLPLPFRIMVAMSVLPFMNSANDLVSLISSSGVFEGGRHLDIVEVSGEHDEHVVLGDVVLDLGLQEGLQ